MDRTAPALELRGICKRFGTVDANKDVSLKVPKGTVHGIVGENGAGKSTLMSVVYGFYQADAGEISIHGKTSAIRSASDALAAGIGMVHQHFMLVETFSIVENAILGSEGGFRLGKGMRAAQRELADLARQYNLDIPLDKPVNELTVGQQQRGEILKALWRGADILILDEPTSVLTPSEADHLFRVLQTFKQLGKTVVLITHKLREIMAATDNVTVMRHGKTIDTVSTRTASVASLAQMMVGRSVRTQFEKQDVAIDKPVLEVNRLCIADQYGVSRVHDVSFRINTGEIVGVAGVAGNGQSELLEAITGMRSATGDVKLLGRRLSLNALDSYAMRDLGVGHVPEDRQGIGLVVPFKAQENTILGHHRAPPYCRKWLLDHDAIESDTRRKMENFDIRPPIPQLRTALFSGGNQQKLVLAREIEQDPQLLIVGQPTRGVDIGAVEFIHQRLIDMRNAGKAVLMVSVDLDEILRLADRILVMFAGRIVGETTADVSRADLGLMMTGMVD